MNHSKFEIADIGTWGGTAMLMDADAGEGGVKNHLKSADVVYGRLRGQKLAKPSKFGGIKS